MNSPIGHENKIKSIFDILAFFTLSNKSVNKDLINEINKFQPDLYIPAAGPPVFLDPNLIHINYQEVNIFSSPYKFKDYLNDDHYIFNEKLH